MIIDALSVLDFRVFSGLHHFDLAPKIKGGKHAPIILFGGLNGGGKTTVLSALKLALYGRGVLASNNSLSDYHQYLRECIHRAHNSIAIPSRAALELTFRYSQHGVISSFHLTRDWTVDPVGRVNEGLLIVRDGQALSELSYDQAQSFLNELIPVGVSELFFFDGEKISSLAEETTGATLRESINKLLGLDLIERLDSDLAVLIKTRSLKQASQERKTRVAEAEREFERLQSKVVLLRNQLLNLQLDIVEASSNLVKVSSSIDARGGAWSESKQQESAHLESLIVQKKTLEYTLHDLLGGVLPLAISKRLNEKLLIQLGEEQRTSQSQILAGYLERQQQQFLGELTAAFGVTEDKRALLDDIFQRTFGSEVSKLQISKSKIHDLADNHRASIAHRLSYEASSAQQQVSALALSLHKIDEAIDSAGENISRAPDEKVLIPLFQQQGHLQGRLAALHEQKSAMGLAVKGALNELRPAARRLDILHTEIAKSQEDERMFVLARRARGVLKEFSARARVQKLHELESQFYSSFNGLARKADRHFSIRIDPDSFEVMLIDDYGHTLRKDELSAGEKQIFAISVLEALARTSGRNLPVVIDTPLGRLDSVHRRKLVDNYLPKTSHQVIILSTDTEIDATFYESLRSHISHSYHLIYNPDTRSTQVKEGYFWRSAESS